MWVSSFLLRCLGGTRRIGVFWDLLCESPTQEVLAANMRIEEAGQVAGRNPDETKQIELRNVRPTHAGVGLIRYLVIVLLLLFFLFLLLLLVTLGCQKEGSSTRPMS